MTDFKQALNDLTTTKQALIAALEDAQHYKRENNRLYVDIDMRNQDNAKLRDEVRGLTVELDDEREKVGILMQPKPAVEGEFPWAMMRIWVANRDVEKREHREQVLKLTAECEAALEQLKAKHALTEEEHPTRPRPPEDEVAWLQRMLKLEEERGEFPPNGAAGGVVAKYRREEAAKTKSLVEIERKFLIDPTKLPPLGEGTLLKQCYLVRHRPSVRIRMSPTKAWLTIKGPGVGITRDEFEYVIPMRDAEAMSGSLGLGGLTKTRHIVEHAGHKWEVDQFHDEHLGGLWLAEVELKSEDEEFEKPDWLGQEVSENPHYTNASLALDGAREDAKRPETGSMQFGDDWRGVFIRGDDSFNYSSHLKLVIDKLAEDREAMTVIGVAVVRGLLELLESSNEHADWGPDHLDSPVQKLRSFDACR